MPITIQEIYDREDKKLLKLELWSFLSMLEKLHIQELSINYWDDAFMDSMEDTFQIWQHHSECSDGRRGVWIYSLGYQGEQFALIAETGREGRDDGFAYLTNLDLYLKACDHILRIAPQSEQTQVTDPFEVIGDDYLYGNRVDYYFGTVDEEWDTEREARDAELLRLHIGILADRIALGEDPEEVLEDSEYLSGSYACFWLHCIEDEEDTAERLRSVDIEICDLIADAVEESQSLSSSCKSP